MIVYLAYPVDAAQGKHLSAVVELHRRITRHHTVYEPGLAWSTTGEPDPRVQQVNDAALERCDALVAYYPDYRSTGVPYEIGRALAIGVPTCVIIGDETRASWALVGSGAVLVQDGQHAIKWLDTLGEPRPAGLEAKVAYLNPELGTRPDRVYEGDAGFDLYVSETVTLEPGTFTNVRSHIAVELPPNTWAMLVGRSSTFYRHGLMVNPAIIDNGYRGELFACVYNPGPGPFEAKAGDRLAQIIPMPLLAPSIRLVDVDTLTPSDRGGGGYGSTGR